MSRVQIPPGPLYFNMRTETYQGKKFKVTIRRNTMRRRYVLSTLEEDETWKQQNEPLYSEEFRKHYGFSEDWPHETID